MSYVALDLDNCKVLFKAECMQSACLISALEYPEVTHCIFPVERDRHPNDKKIGGQRTLPKTLTVMECKMLWRSITGAEWTSSNIGQLLDQLQEKLVELPCDQRSLMQLMSKAGPADLPIDIGDWPAWKRPPHYAEVSKPHEAGKAPASPAMPWSIPAAPGAAEGRPRLPWEAADPAPIQPAPKLPWEAGNQVESTQSAEQPWVIDKEQGFQSKAPTVATIPEAPKATPTKGATARVWAIADELLSKIGGGDMKELKRRVVNAAEAEGLNGGTAGTQFGRWKASKWL